MAKARYYRSASGAEAWKVSEMGIFYVRLIQNSGNQILNACFMQQKFEIELENEILKWNQTCERDFYVGSYRIWLKAFKKQLQEYENQTGDII